MAFVILSEVESESPMVTNVDLGLAKANLLARRRQSIKYAWIRARGTLAFDCVRLLMGHKPQRNLTSLRMTKNVATFFV